ncbi:MAG: D-alanyl-D-alanine carboxypeptidase family protein [Alphaproteobacteria bacterium]
MTINLLSLDTQLQKKLILLLDRCGAHGFAMRPFFAVRTPLQQAALWRQSRSIEEISATIRDLRGKKATYLAGCLEKVGAQPDHKHGVVTNALPGLSWHNWGQAVDCVHISAEGKAIWQGMAYDVYAAEAIKLGLTAGHYWKMRDSVHVQLPMASSPLGQYQLLEINDIMEERFGTI